MRIINLRKTKQAMSEAELKLFKKKVNSLTKLVDSLKTHPEREQLLANCVDHDEVVKLAKEWGYDIGRRWGGQI